MEEVNSYNYSTSDDQEPKHRLISFIIMLQENHSRCQRKQKKNDSITNKTLIKFTLQNVSAQQHLTEKFHVTECI